MKAALVYTGTTPELIELVEQEVRKNIGPDAEIISSADPTIIGEVRQAGYVTPGAAEKIADQVDVIVLAQGSMAYVEQDIEKAVGKPTLSSPRFGALELKKALQAKGLMA